MRIIQTWLGNLIWMILLLMPAVAGFLKLLYRRRNRFFVEHLVFSFHFHSFAFLALAFQLGFFPSSLIAIFLTLLLILIYLFLAMWNFYKQSFLKTFGKLFVLLWGYFFDVFRYDDRSKFCDFLV